MKYGAIIALVLSCAATAARAGDAPPEILVRQVPAEGIVSNRFEVTIRNTNGTDVTIIKPLNGSAWSWYLPFYAFHVTDANGRELRMATRHFISGLYPGTAWPADYVVRLRPGESFVRAFDLLMTVPETGTYTVRFDYVMDISQDRFKGRLLEYPERAWHGTASSRPTRYRLVKQRH